MEILIISVSAILIILGIIGSILPVLPGPPIGFAGLLILNFLTKYTFTSMELVVIGILTVLVTLLDYVIQIYGVKKYGGGKMAINGTVIGFIVGVFFPPFGIILGPFAGAFAGAIIERKKHQNTPFKIALGAFAGFVGGTILKLIFSLYITYMFINVLFL